MTRVFDSISRRSKWLIRCGWSMAVVLCAVLVPQRVWSDSFARSMTPPGNDLQVNSELPGLLPFGSSSDQHHGMDGWHASSLSDRVAYRSDWPKRGSQGSLVDKNLVAPRTWVIQDLFHGMETITTIVEKDRLCLDNYFYSPVWSFVGDIYQDHWYFYSRKTFLCLGASVGVAAVLANTSLDQEFRDWFQDNLATQKADWEFAKFMGESWVVSAFLLGTWAIDQWAPPYGFFREHLWTPELGYWSRQSLRALLVGAPAVLLLPYGTGASRPGETAHGSEWRPFSDNNGASGHAFVGAVPFLVAARRTDHFLLKAAFFAGSGLTGYSRINDDAHYLSQVLLGWSVAYLAVEATHWTEHSHLQYRIVPLTIDGLVGIGVETRY